MQNKAKENGGVKSIEATNEKVDKNTAEVEVKITYDNGTESKEKVRLIKVDDEWKIRM